MAVTIENPHKHYHVIEMRSGCEVQWWSVIKNQWVKSKNWRTHFHSFTAAKIELENALNNPTPN